MYEEVKGKRLLFLGAIRALCEPVKIAKEMEIYTIVIDYLPDSPAKKVADEAHLISTTDVDAVVEFCKKEKVDGIFTAFIDSMLPYAREICDRLNLPFYASKEQIHMSLDKKFFKEVCREYGVSVPKDYKDAITNNDIDVTKVEFPVIVKPVDSSGGRGVRICRTKEELHEAYEYALSVSPGKNVLVEEYVVGDEITATYTMKNGEISLSCFRDKLISEDHENITSQGDVLVCPSCYLPMYQREINPNVVSMLKGMKATDGTVFFQGVATKERIVLFECGYRPNGAHDYRLIEEINGINFMKMMLYHAVTGEMGCGDLSKDNAEFPEYMLNYNIWLHGGTISKQFGLEDALALKCVKSAEYMHDVGEKIVDNNTLSQRGFRAVIRSGNIKEVAEAIKSIQNAVDVLDENGKSMKYKDFDVRRLFERYGENQ
ncbi:MAG: ATP-grasp domain-containing protein [Clostridia bacterium]|nr:ATP-grasp domain-containing protein [Clostridia bacterium]